MKEQKKFSLGNSRRNNCIKILFVVETNRRQGKPQKRARIVIRFYLLIEFLWLLA